MKENYFLDDGAYSALQIIVELARQQVEGGKSITEDLLSRLPEPLEAAEFRLKLQVIHVACLLQRVHTKSRFQQQQ